jgi:hypothetical protein
MYNDYNWLSTTGLLAKSFVCGHCGSDVAPAKGYVATVSGNRPAAFIYICHKCHQPNYFDINEKQNPGAAFGNFVKDIPDKNVEFLYEEARKCTSSNSYTAAVLCSRKLLMHIAVSKGAKDGLSFKEYVEYLDSIGYIPPDGKAWVNHIREKGNEANHEIVIMEKEDAEDLISFLEMLLKFIYEFPAKIKKPKS